MVEAMKAHQLLIVLASLLLPAAVRAEPKPRNVAIVVYDRAEILDFAGPAEVLAAAGNFAGYGKSALNVYLVGRTTDPIKAQGFIKITPDYSIENAPAPDLVVIPGGASASLSDDPAMLKWLTTVTAKSETTLTVCTGVFPLAMTGVLDGKDITTWYGALENLQASAPRVRVQYGRRFVDNGRYITTAGVSAGIDGALHLVARMFGRRIADQTARYMEYHWTPESYLASKYSYWNPSADERGRQLQQAEAATEEKRWGEAITLYKKVAIDDKSGVATLGLGNALMVSGDRKGAIAAYQQIGATSPVYVTAAYNLACAYALEGKKAQAVAMIKKAISAGASKTQAASDPDLASIKDEIAKLTP
jgi:transcriptional regulator GlxA family with amidase domain